MRPTERPPGLTAYEIELEGERFLVVCHDLAPREGRRALTRSERDVLALLEEGLGDLEIAARRNTTRSTITKQVHSIFGKLGVSSRRQLLARPR